MVHDPQIPDICRHHDEQRASADAKKSQLSYFNEFVRELQRSVCVSVFNSTADFYVRARIYCLHTLVV